MILFLTVVLRKIRLSVTRKVWKTAVPTFARLLFSLDRFHTQSAPTTKLLELGQLIFVFIFVQAAFGFNSIQFRTEPGTISRDASVTGDSQVDSELQLDLEIALSGVPAKVQPHGLAKPS